jgi:hypothetical protein
VVGEGRVREHGHGVGVVALGGEEFLEGSFYTSLVVCSLVCMTETRTVYRPLVWPVVAEPLRRPVAPVAALDSARARKVPATLSWSRIWIHH